jgi:hypothetical protein
MPPKQPKPRVGDLVKLDQWACAELEYHDINHGHRPGLVFECVGIRCGVLWSNGRKTYPAREVLEVVSATG